MDLPRRMDSCLLEVRSRAKTSSRGRDAPPWLVLYAVILPQPPAPVPACERNTRSAGDHPGQGFSLLGDINEIESKAGFKACAIRDVGP